MLNTNPENQQNELENNLEDNPNSTLKPNSSNNISKPKIDFRNKILIAIAGSLVFMSFLISSVFFYQLYINPTWGGFNPFVGNSTNNTSKNPSKSASNSGSNNASNSSNESVRNSANNSVSSQSLANSSS